MRLLVKAIAIETLLVYANAPSFRQLQEVFFGCDTVLFGDRQRTFLYIIPRISRGS